MPHKDFCFFPVKLIRPNTYLNAPECGKLLQMENTSLGTDISLHSNLFRSDEPILLHSVTKSTRKSVVNKNKNKNKKQERTRTETRMEYEMRGMEV